MVPSVYVTLQGADPVSVKVNVAGSPLHIIVVPLKATVGRGFTVTTALPIISPACATQLASDKAVMV